MWSENAYVLDGSGKLFIQTRASALVDFLSFKLQIDRRFTPPTLLDCSYGVSSGLLESMRMNAVPINLRNCWWFQEPMLIPYGLGRQRHFVVHYRVLAELYAT